MKSDVLKQQTLAIAALFQCCDLAGTLSKKGTVDTAAFQVAIDSLYQFSSDDFDVIYHDSAYLRLGLQLISSILGKESRSGDPELTRFVLQLLKLEKKLRHSAEAKALLHERLKQAEKLLAFAHDGHGKVMMDKFAATMTDLERMLGCPVTLYGLDEWMQRPHVVNQCKALLLAGLRAVILWRHYGGQRRQLLLSCQKIEATAKTLLAGFEKTPALA